MNNKQFHNYLFKDIDESHARAWRKTLLIDGKESAKSAQFVKTVNHVKGCRFI